MHWVNRAREAGRALMAAVRKHGPRVRRGVESIREYRTRRQRRARPSDLDDSVATLESLRRRE